MNMDVDIDRTSVNVQRSVYVQVAQIVTAGKEEIKNMEDTCDLALGGGEWR